MSTLKIYTPPEKSNLKIIHQDDDIIVVSKPSGLLSVPGRNPDHHASVHQYIADDIPTARIIHRLDMDTSGLMVLAIHADSQRHLNKQFETRKVTKHYTADIWGHPNDEHGEIDLPLRCDWPNRPLQMVDHTLGKPSKTLWRVLTHTDSSTRVELTPITGRSHQLRVHMREIGHPILGDVFYAKGDALLAAPRLCLHASVLCFEHPANARMMRFDDQIPF